MIWRTLTSALLALTLVLTSHAMATARGAAVATGQMVICTGEGTITVFTDADGAPVAAPHICPDCLASVVLGTVPAGPMLPKRVLLNDLGATSQPVLKHARPRIGWQSRAPPLSA